MATLYAYRGRLLRRAQEWAADHFKFVQYPRPRYRVQAVAERDWIDLAFRVGLIAFAMWWIWSGIALALIVIALALIG